MSEMNRRDERRAEKTVEKQLRRSSKEQERTLRRQKAENADDRSAIRERYRKKSAARMEKKSMFRTMIGVFGSIKTRRKFFMPTNFQTKVLSSPVNAITTVSTAGRI